MLLQIPFQNFSYYRQTVTLDKIPYVFVFKYNTEFDFYTIDILNVDGDLLIAGLKLVLDVDLITPYSNELLPKGKLYCVAKNKNAERIGKNNILTDIALIYEAA